MRCPLSSEAQAEAEAQAQAQGAGAGEAEAEAEGEGWGGGGGTGANMWKARAIMRRMSMSSCAPRVLSTGMRTKSIRPEDAWLGLW